MKEKKQRKTRRNYDAAFKPRSYYLAASGGNYKLPEAE
ncbi:MAG: hypothetical protein ACI85O_001949 [Saprospiraceae bacterium]|jgi:hypothetical protein